MAVEAIIKAIKEQTSVENALRTRRWESIFDPSTMIRAKAYASAASIKELELIELRGSGGLIITAEIQGNRTTPYSTSLELRQNQRMWAVETNCTCPVGEECKHGAALMLFLCKNLDVEASNAAATATDRELQTWLLAIGNAAVSTPATTPKPSKSTADNRFLAYCIEETSSRTFQFSMRVATRLKDGSVRAQGSHANADPSRPPKYMAKNDLMVASLFRQRQYKHGGWGGMNLIGPDWDDLLEEAMATGRMHFGRRKANTRNDLDYQPLQAGPPETVEATWETLPDGNLRPVLRGGRSGMILLPTEPARYIDPNEGLLGPVTNPLPSQLLTAWSRGPLIDANKLPTLIERLSLLPGPRLPLPVEIENETRPTLPPSPLLRVGKQTIGDRWERQELIVGQILFHYGDSPALPPLVANAAQEHAILRDGKRIIWPRDFQAEQSAIKKLLLAGTRALTFLIPPALRDAGNASAVIPSNFFKGDALAWIELLEGPEFAKLREQGWTIEIDPACGLTLHDASDFIPAIEAENEHGIDWFRFDASYEIEGQRVSLIPVIAHAIKQNFPPADSPTLPEFIFLPADDNPESGFIRFPAKPLMEIVDHVRHLFQGGETSGRIDRLTAAGMADAMAIDATETTRALARLGRSLRDIHGLPAVALPDTVKAELRGYQCDGFRWLQFLARQGLHGILADDMGLGKTLQTLAHLAAEHAAKPGKPSLVISPTSVVPNWAAEAARFIPSLKVLTLHGTGRNAGFKDIGNFDVVLTSYPLLSRDFTELSKHDWHVVALDEAQHIKNPKAVTAQSAFQLKAAHRICLSGTPMENHLGELWSLMRFLMPGFLGDEKSFNTRLRKPIERDRSTDAQLALNRRVSPLILRRTKDQVATELPAKTVIVHHIDLTKKQTDLYESVRAAMDRRVRDAIADKGLAKSHIIVLDALLKLRQICCHPQLLKNAAAAKVTDSAKLDHLTKELLPTLLEEGRRILIFSQFTSMLALIESHLEKENIPFLKLTGQTKDRASLVKTFQSGEVPIFLISLKAGGTGLNLTAADTVIHYDPWWNPAAENQATDRAHRIGQTKPVFVHKLVCRGSIEDRILDLQKHKSALIEALLSEETSKLKIDQETLSQLLAPLD
ncbi:MAG: helicase SNF [Verrucomicrobia bacterium]|nr:MAG: helicase SNF [Verrucomicrobiota bacterium]TAE88350.1 MAG: helicase SNF [Verrucomicrobiota bacterium]TAF26804.1 MAG: helicase SNF [Verrucomicrobiota bacterium]TAF42061.1 MAG: helicase SNF [Verrucomicrobiota bacterium]